MSTVHLKKNKYVMKVKMWNQDWSNSLSFFNFGVLDQDIDGEAYIELTESLMTEQLGLKVGQMLKLSKHLKKLVRIYHFLQIAL